jgi:hypothetical protein
LLQKHIGQVTINLSFLSSVLLHNNTFQKFDFMCRVSGWNSLENKKAGYREYLVDISATRLSR